jgi:hypothetical protein
VAGTSLVKKAGDEKRKQKRRVSFGTFHIPWRGKRARAAAIPPGS